MRQVPHYHLLVISAHPLSPVVTDLCRLAIYPPTKQEQR
jgi:hypothetical protein